MMQGYVSQTKGFAQQILQANRQMQVSEQRISTGDSFAGRIQNPVDVIKASRAEAEMRGNHMASRNIQDALSFLELKQGGLSEVASMGQRLHELSVQYQNDELTDKDRDAIKKETASLLAGIEHTLGSTQFNNRNAFANRDTAFQAGSNSGDTLVIKAPQFGTVHTIENRTPVRIDSKTYALDVQVPGSSHRLTGDLTFDLRADGKPSSFTIREGSVTHHGTISFSDDKTGAFTLDYNGERLSGALSLTSDADKVNMAGSHRYTLNWDSGGGSASVNFTQTGQQTKETVEVSHTNISLREATRIPVEKALSADFAEKHILEPIASMQAQTAIDMATFDRRLESVQNKETLATANLSRIRDTDVAREMMALSKQQMLASINANLLSRKLGEHRNHIMTLLA